MIGVGESVAAEAAVWLGPNEKVTLGEIVESGPVLLLFYLFDWTAT